MRRWAQVAPGEAQVQYYENIAHGKGGQTLEQAAQESGGINIPGSIEKPWGCGIWDEVFCGKLGGARLMVRLDDIRGLFQQ